MKNILKTFLRDEDGAALVEYGVALLVVILAGTGGLVLLAENTEATFSNAAEIVTPIGGADPVVPVVP